MKALVEGFINRQPVVYLLFAAVALIDGFLHHWVTTRAERDGVEPAAQCESARSSSPRGMMAGGALGGSSTRRCG